MTPEEAIKINEDIKRRHYNRMVEQERKAITLGIEALKVLIKERRDLVSYAGELLPGETE